MARHARRSTLLSQLSFAERWALGGTAGLAGLALVVAGAIPAQAESPADTGHRPAALERPVGTGHRPAAADRSDGTGHRPAAAELLDGTLDPATFAGTAVVATTAGDVVVEVEAGALLPTAERVRAEVAAGRLVPSHEAAQPDFASGSGSLKAGGCRDWANAVASPFGYAASTTGCAVLGYPGYQRVYNWSNGSDVQLCVQAKSFSGAGQGWTSIGCQGNRDFLVPWGNTFAATQVRGKSLSGVTGAGYIWWD